MKVIRIAALVAAATLVTGVASASAVTLKLYSQAGFGQQFDAHGNVVPQSSRTKPKTGWGFVSFGTDYVGTQASHAPTAVGTDNLYCVVIKWPRGNCIGEIFSQTSVLQALLSNMRLDINPNPQVIKVTYATGVLAHVKKFTVANVKGFPNDSEFTIPGVAAPTTP